MSVMNGCASRSRARPALLLLAAGLPLAGGGSVLSAQEFHVDVDADNHVTFVSRASIEEFEGVTQRIDGYVLLNTPLLSLETGGEGTELYMEVDLASLDTGIGLRNRHMRENYLEVERYPYAIYQARIDRVENLSGGRMRVASSGRFSIHGVTREIAVPCDVTPDEDGYRARCAFQVLLSDYDIEIPSVMFMKLSNEIRVRLDFRVAPAGGGS